MAGAARAQAAAAAKLAWPRAPDKTAVAKAVAARIPPIAADGHRRDATWREGLALMLASFDAMAAPASVAATIAEMRRRDPAQIENLADAFLRGGVDPADAAAAFDRGGAAGLFHPPGVDVVRLRPQAARAARSLPLMQLDLVGRIITASGQNPGARYLHCSLCSTAWNHTRAVCIVCSGSRTLALRGIEGDPGVARAETCDDCGTYAKVFYEAKDAGVDAYADDLATLGLDMMVGEAGWARHAPHPLLLIG